MSLWNEIGNRWHHPRGLVGRLAGHAMAIMGEKANRLAVDALHIGVRDTILELGFGPGRAIELLASRATEGLIYGIDQSEIMLEQAKRRNRLAVRTGRVFLYKAPFEALPFPDESIDKVLAVNVVCFWADPMAVMGEIRRVLRPNGCVSIYANDMATKGNWRFAGRETNQRFLAAELTDLFLQGGFDKHRTFVRSIEMSGWTNGLLATVSGPRKSIGPVHR